MISTARFVIEIDSFERKWGHEKKEARKSKRKWLLSNFNGENETRRKISRYEIAGILVTEIAWKSGSRAQIIVLYVSVDTVFMLLLNNFKV